MGEAGFTPTVTSGQAGRYRRPREISPAKSYAHDAQLSADLQLTAAHLRREGHLFGPSGLYPGAGHLKPPLPMTSETIRTST